MIKHKKLNLWIKAILPSILAVFVALVIGGIIITIKGVNPFNAYGSMIKAAFYQTSTRYPFNGLAKTLVYATPLIFASMGVMIAFKAGMFNIGVQGQMMAGGIGAAIVGLYFNDYFSNMYVAIFVAMLFGFIWAGIAGVLKSVFSINEVISTIMLNYIISPFQNYLISGPMRDQASSNVQTVPISEGVRMPTLFQSITKQSLNIGLIIAIVVCILIYFFFKYTTLGYKIKAVGYNVTSAENAGINSKWIAFISMGIAGAVSGLAGAERILGGSTSYVYTDAIMGDFGFTAIAVSLLGNNNPFGIIVASIFYAALEIGGQSLQIDYKLDKEIVYIIQALIIILVAGGNIFKYLMNRKGKK
ncbi:ABC transporter permease [Oceanivirga miroungae]|uniref:Inner-membrane translocator n=1 Tax=Oceanivirga miroungae TaxID=1130046 RepID=A0A6I8MBC6_9FUSO|nr:ABC transporter permease [Oceanivirga miroungae]VWL85546.1 inner-membrane translocator [Oceanivirga miroungae]